MILSHASLDMQLIIHAGIQVNPDSKVHGANMGPIWGRQDPGGPHVVPMNFAIWKTMLVEGAQLSALFYVVISEMLLLQLPSVIPDFCHCLLWWFLGVL